MLTIAWPIREALGFLCCCKPHPNQALRRFSTQPDFWGTNKSDATAERCAQCVYCRELIINMSNRCFGERIHETFDGTKLSFISRFLLLGSIVKKLGMKLRQWQCALCTMSRSSLTPSDMSHKQIFWPRWRLFAASHAMKIKIRSHSCCRRNCRKSRMFCRRGPDLSQQPSSGLEWQGLLGPLELFRMSLMFVSTQNVERLLAQCDWHVTFTAARTSLFIASGTTTCQLHFSTKYRWFPVNFIFERKNHVFFC